MNERETYQETRRDFLKKTAVGAAAVGLGTPLVAASKPRHFKVGVIGSGGRGSGAAADALKAATLGGDTAEIFAVADLFRDKAERARRTHKVPKERTFTGFDCFRKLLEIKELDYVILATPPHFRPEHFEATIQAGRHVFTEKPAGVDAPGIRRFLAAGETAKSNGLSVAAGTQRRHQKHYLECLKRVQDGAIGTILSARCYWNQGGLWTRSKEEDWSDMEWQVRNWLYFTWLSGDHIVEQHVHNLDVVNWFLGALNPVEARGMGGRQVRQGKPEFGNVFDHFATELIYPSPDPKRHRDIRVTSMCRQIDACWDEVSESFVGTEGSCFLSAGGGAEILGQNPWKSEATGINPYVQEHVDLQADIKAGGGSLNEAETVAHSTMTAILARTSCYTGRQLKWGDALKSNEQLGPKAYEFGPLAFPKVAQVGKPM